MIAWLPYRRIVPHTAVKSVPLNKIVGGASQTALYMALLRCNLIVKVRNLQKLSSMYFGSTFVKSQINKVIYAYRALKKQVCL